MSPEREPRSGLVRPRGMRTLATTTAACLALLAGTGCGGPAGDASTDAAADASDSAAPGASWHGCDRAELAAAPGRSGTLRGPDGPVRVTVLASGEGPCRAAVVARGAGGITGLATADLDLDQATARVVRLRGAGAPELLRVDSRPHPRGGFAPHLFLVTDDGPVEVLHDGSPLVPFVATDGGAAPMTATCAPAGRVALLTTTTSKPPGVILAWDVRRTTYKVGEGDATEVSSVLVRDHAADPVLRRDLPALFEPGALFAGCSAPWGRG